MGCFSEVAADPEAEEAELVSEGGVPAAQRPAQRSAEEGPGASPGRRAPGSRPPRLDHPKVARERGQEERHPPQGARAVPLQVSVPQRLADRRPQEPAQG